jgi:hypothetical protein
MTSLEFVTLEVPDPAAAEKVATSSKEDTGPATRDVDDVVLLLEAPGAQVTLPLLGRKADAKDAGVSPDGTGSHRIVIGGGAGAVTDPDGFVQEATEQMEKR